MLNPLFKFMWSCEFHPSWHPFARTTVTKKDGPTESHSPNALPAPEPWTAQPFTVRLAFMGTHPTLNYRLSNADLTAIRQTHRDTVRLSTHFSQDLFTHTHHQNTCISFTICTCSKSSSSFLLTHRQRLRSFWEFSSLLLHPPHSCSMNLATYQTQRNNPRHSRNSHATEHFPSLVLLFLKIISLSYHSAFPAVSHLYPLFVFYLQLYVLSPPLYPKNLLLSLSQTCGISSQKVRYFFKKLLQNVQYRSNSIQDLSSCHLNWIYLINAGRRHLHPCTQLKTP